MLSLLKATWRGWKRAVHGINAGIAFVLMSVVYWSAMFPVAVFFRLFRPDPIDRGLGDAQASTYWIEVQTPRQDVRRAQRPW